MTSCAAHVAPCSRTCFCSAFRSSCTDAGSSEPTYTACVPCVSIASTSCSTTPVSPGTHSPCHRVTVTSFAPSCVSYPCDGCGAVGALRAGHERPQALRWHHVACILPVAAVAHVHCDKLICVQCVSRGMRACHTSLHLASGLGQGRARAGQTRRSTRYGCGYCGAQAALEKILDVATLP